MVDDGRPRTAAQWVKQHSKHRKNIRLVLMELAAFIDAGNDCPSHNELADETGLAKSTIQHALGELERDGTIAREKNGGKKTRGGHTNCYRIPGLTPETVPQESTPVESIPDKSIPQESVPQESTLSPEPAEYAPVHVYTGSDAAGEKDLSLEQKQKTKDKKTLSPGTGESIPPENSEIRPDPFDDMIAAISQVFGVIDKEALNYYHMLSGTSKKDGWIQPIFQAAPMLEDELRAWSKWHVQKQQGAAHVKKPEKVASSVGEYRRIQALKRSALTPKQYDTITPAEREAARREFHFDVPVFKPIGSPS